MSDDNKVDCGRRRFVTAATAVIGGVGMVATGVAKSHFRALDFSTLQHFENEMVAHSKSFNPRLCGVLGEAQLRVALRQAMQRADGYQFTFRGPIRFYIEMMFIFGSDFDTDPQYPAFGRILKTDREQMQRADNLYDATIVYIEQVPSMSPHRALKMVEALPGIVTKLIASPSDSLVEGIRRVMWRVYPQKALYLGNEKLEAFIHDALARAKTLGFSNVRGQILVVALMFSLGHGCTLDPLYPWISQALKETRTFDPAARAQILEEKTTAWVKLLLSPQT